MTAKANIKVHKGTMRIKVGDQKIEFNMCKTGKFPEENEQDQICGVQVVDMDSVESMEMLEHEKEIMVTKEMEEVTTEAEKYLGEVMQETEALNVTSHKNEEVMSCNEIQKKEF